MTDLVERLTDRAESYRQGGPSSEHTAVMLEEAAARISQQDAELERWKALYDREKAAHRISVDEATAGAQKAAFIEAAGICTGWLDNFTDTPIVHVPAETFASDAVRDIRDALRAKAEETRT